MSADDWLSPKPLEPGDTVRVIAPSGPFDSRLVWRGLGWLSERYEVRFDRGMFASRGYLAGDDERRARELDAALVEPGVHAVLCARGGYGASRFVHRLDWSALRRNPRWIVGFSDVTALHVEAARQRVASVHGPNVTALGQSHAVVREAFVEALEAPHRPRRYEGLDVLAEGVAEGTLHGGNLTLLHACAAGRRLRLPSGTILFLEDVTERPYRIDRMLASLVAGGHFDDVNAFVLGDFTDCGPGRDGVSVLDVVRDVLLPLGKPVVSGIPCGHGLVNEPLVLGRFARLRRDALELG